MPKKIKKQHSIWPKSSLLSAGLGLLLSHSAQAASVDFYRDVYPFLKANCLACHNKTTTKAGLDMETPESMRKGGESGPAIIPGKSKESLIVLASLHQKDMEMPPANNKSGAVKLTTSEVSLLKSWIDQGAKNSVQQERQVVWQSLAGNVHPIYSVALTKDGRYAVCGRSNNLFLYDLATRQFVAQIVDDTQKTGTAHRALVQSLAFSPDGTRLASGSFREVKIWREEKTKAFTQPANPSWGLHLGTLTEDGKSLFGVNEKGALVLVDVSKGKVLKRFTDLNKSGIKQFGISPDSSHAVILGNDSVLSVVALKNGKTLTAQPAAEGLRFITWLADGQSFATLGADKTIRVFALPAAKASELTVKPEIKTTGGNITLLQRGITPDSLLAYSDDGKARFWSLTKGVATKEIAIPNSSQLTLSVDGRQLATCGNDGIVRVWDVESGKQLTELRGRYALNQKIAGLEWTVAAQGLEQTFQKREITRIEAQNKALEELLKKANETITAMKKVVPEKNNALKPTQEAKAAAQKAVDDIKAEIAKAPEGKADAALEKKLKEAQDKLGPATMAESTAQAALSNAESNLKDAEDDVTRINESKTKNAQAIEAAKTAVESSKKALDQATADLNAAKQVASKQTGKPLALAFSTDSQRLAAVYEDGSLNVWAITSGTIIEGLDGSASTAACLINQANGSFVAALPDGTTLSSSSTPRWVLERTLGVGKDKTLFADRVNAVRFSPDGKTLATGGGEPSRSGDISLFDVTSGKVLKTWKERHTDAVLSLDFSPDGKLIASGGADKIARVFEVATGNQVNLFEGHTHHVMGVTFRADGRVLASAGADGAVIVWDMIMGERKRKIEGWTKEVTSLQFIGASSQIVTSAGDNLVRIINDDGGEVRAISKLPDFMQAAASTANASIVIGGGEDSVLRVWDGTNGKEVAVFGAK